MSSLPEITGFPDGTGIGALYTRFGGRVLEIFAWCEDTARSFNQKLKNPVTFVYCRLYWDDTEKITFRWCALHEMRGKDVDIVYDWIEETEPQPDYVHPDSKEETNV